MKNSQSPDGEFGELLQIMAQLRGQNGCPWDKDQTHVSLKSSLLEESYELLDAIDGGKDETLREELGDLLHQIIFHCQIASERGAFTANDVIAELKDKMVRRHPHVFSGSALLNSDAVLKQWARLKAEEKEKDSSKSALGNLPKAMPALARAQTIMVNIARFLDLRSEEVLTRAIERFIQRFGYIETRLRDAGKTPAASTLEEMDTLWNEAKQLERKDTDHL